MDYSHELVMPNNDLSFKMFRYEGFNGKHKVPKHWHHSVEIFAVIEGSIEIYINSTKFFIKENEALIINSNQIHSIEAKEANDIVVIQIPFEFFAEYCDGNYLYFKQNCKSEKIFLLCKRMYDFYNKKNYGYKLKIKVAFNELLYLMVTKYKTNGIGEELLVNNEKINQLSRITDYIKTNHSKHLTLKDVADEFGFSPTYLSRIFQKNAGTNFKTYIQNVRVGFAYKELVNTHNTIGKIALDCGFPNVKAFTLEFKKRYGVVPSQFRKITK